MRQMWLEHYLLEHPEENGFFCVSTSYRNEPDPIPGRHDRIFPMFEFELKGGMDELKKMEVELLEYLGFKKNENGEYPSGNYDDVAKEYGVDELENEHEERLEKDHGPVFFLENFPRENGPFWNMKLQEKIRNIQIRLMLSFFMELKLLEVLNAVLVRMK